MSALVLGGLAACGGGSSNSLGDQPTLSGQISGWTRGAGWHIDADPYGKGITTAPVDAAGNFSITLPSGSALTDQLQHGMLQQKADAYCTGSSLAEPTDYLAYMLILGVGMGTGESMIGVELTTPAQSESITLVTYYYFDRDARVTGEVDCTAKSTSGYSQLTFDVDAKVGWNRIVFSTYGKDPSISKIASAPVPAGVAWYAGL